MRRLVICLLALAIVAILAATASNQAAGAPSDGPPPPDGYFTLQPVGTWSGLPSGASCAGQVHRSTWEPRPDNTRRNHVVPNTQTVHDAFAARPVGGYDPHWNSWLLPRVDGQFTGTTDEIFQWAACKWGLPDNVIRAVAYQESTWYQYLVYPNWHNRCVSYYGCGDFFGHSNPDSIVYMNELARFGYDYQQDYGAGLGPETFSILGIKSWQAPSWGQMPGNQNGTFPFNRNSTAFAADYYGSDLRGCFEGWISWLHAQNANYGPGDLWGCVGNWYSGDWHDSGADQYTSEVQGHLDDRIWLQPGFPNDRPGCHPTYGCPGPDTLPLEPPPPPPPAPLPPPPPPPPPPAGPPRATACRVPRVVGRPLASARARLRAAHCKVGRVRRVHSRPSLRGRVLAQNPRAGKMKRRGYPVSLRVGRR